MAFIVVDTNVVVSAATRKSGPARRAFESVLLHHVMAQSDATFGELRRTLLRPEFGAMASRATRIGFLERVRDAAVFFSVEAGLPISRDPTDDAFLHLAIAARASAIITGDQDLLVLHRYAGIPILSPTAFNRVERLIRRGRTVRGVAANGR